MYIQRPADVSSGTIERWTDRWIIDDDGSLLSPICHAVRVSLTVCNQPTIRSDPRKVFF